MASHAMKRKKPWVWRLKIVLQEMCLGYGHCDEECEPDFIENCHDSSS